MSTSQIDKEPQTEKRTDKISNNFPTDGREQYDWKSKYPSEARRFIKHEKIYLLVILGVTCIIAIILGVQYKCHIIENAFALSPTVFSYCFAWVGGMIGGISFTTKWLYRTVARGYWHEERRLWRIFTPWISGVLAVVFVVIMSCYTTGEVYSIPESCGIGFLVGYFSDTAIGKLSDIANVIFAR
mgnify:FL=1